MASRRPVPILHVRQAAGGGGGADRVVLDLVKRLDRNKFSPLVVYLLRNGDPACQPLEELREAGTPCVGLSGGRVFDPRQIRQLSRVIGEHRPRLIHCHDPKSDVLGSWVKWGRSLAAVSTLHGWVRKTRRGHLYAWLDLKALRGFDAVIAVSGYTARVAEESGVKRVDVIRNGIDTTWWQRRSAEPAGARVIAYVGRLSREKAPLDFVRVAHRIAAEEPECRFVVAGEGPERAAMETLAREVALGERMEFLGHVESLRLRELYKGIDVLLLTSQTEGLPIAVLEACAMGTPVVATGVGGVPELVVDGQTGLLAPAGDVEGLARAVLRLLREPPLAARLATDARSRVEQQFSLDTMVSRTEAVYARLLGGA